MLFNKNNTRKINDKKILHKVGKQWKVISVALLMAIGGGAAVTAHANADSTTDGISQATQDEVNSLEAAPQLFKASSANQSNDTSASASATQPSSDNSAPSSVSYLNTDGGSAASYHANALNDSKEIKVNSAKVSDIQTRNANVDAKDLDAVTSATQKSNDDVASASAYSSIASNPSYNSIVSSLAAQQGLTAMDYQFSLSTDFNNYSNAVSNDANYLNQLKQVASAKNSLESAMSNSDNYKIQAAYANAHYQADQFSYSLAESNYQHLESASSTVASDNAVTYDKSLSASTADAIALIDSGLNSSYESSLAKSLGVSTNSLNTTLISYAQSYNNSSTAYTFTNASSKSVSISKENSADFSGLNHVLSDAAAMINYSKDHFSNETPIAPYQLSEASISASNAASAMSADKSISASADAMANLTPANEYTTLNSLLGSSDSAAIQALAGLNSAQTSTTISNAANDLASANLNLNTYRENNNDLYGLDASFAASYASDATSDKAAVASANSNLATLLDAESNNEYSTAVKALNNAANNFANDSKLASAYGMHVYNYAPKYLNVTKDLRVHASTNYSNDDVLADVTKGAVMRVLGIGVGVNGILRYSVEVNGQRGFITANPSYVKNTYLFAPQNNTVNIKATRDIREYRNGNYVKTIKAGTVLKNVTVVGMPDSNFNNQLVYGAFTRVQLGNGDLVTANTNYVQLVNDQASNTTKKSNNSNNNNDNLPLISF